MSKEFTYYMIPSDRIPTKPAEDVWFATWSKQQPVVVWSRERPASSSTCVVAVVRGDQPPPDATLLGGGTKDLPPPPSAPLTVKTASVSDFQQEFSQWLTARSG